MPKPLSGLLALVRAFGRTVPVSTGEVLRTSIVGTRTIPQSRDGSPILFNGAGTLIATIAVVAAARVVRQVVIRGGYGSNRGSLTGAIPCV